MRFVRSGITIVLAVFLMGCSKMQEAPKSMVYSEPAEVIAANDSVEALAGALGAQAKFEDFKGVYDYFLSQHPNSTLLHRDYQSLFDGFQRGADKVEYYRQMYEADPRSAMAAYLYGRCLGGMEAQEYFQKATELDPDYFWGHFGMGAALQSGNPPDTAKALEHYAKAAKIDPTYPTTYAQVVAIHQAHKNYQDALEQAKLYAETSPDQYRPIAAQSDIYTAMGDSKQAEQVLVDFANAHNDNVQVRRVLVDLYKEQARYDEALLHQHFIVGSSRQPADAIVELAKICAMAGQPDSSLHYLNMAADQGYGDYRRLVRNAALAPVRELSGFDELVGRLKVAAKNQKEQRLAPILANAEASKAVALSEKLDSPAPIFAFVNLEGETVSLESLRGKVVIVDFWATWCGPCRMTMPLLQEFVENKPNGVEFISMNVWEDDTTKVRPYLADYGYTFNVLFGNNEVAANYEVSGIPTLVVIDKDGIVRYRHVGYDPSTDQVLLWQAEDLLKQSMHSTS